MHVLQTCKFTHSYLLLTFVQHKPYFVPYWYSCFEALSQTEIYFVFFDCNNNKKRANSSKSSDTLTLIF
jgi:hypothetical protein